jgi:cardiolipin synthase A/B
VILGHDTAAQVEAVMRRYMQAASEIELSRWQHRSLGERVDEWKARVWQYWM